MSGIYIDLAVMHESGGVTEILIVDKWISLRYECRIGGSGRRQRLQRPSAALLSIM